jgi:extracellular elastinolytic metalloproteinase
MKAALAAVLLVAVAIHARSVSNARTFGNFAPKVQRSFNLSPNAQIGPFANADRVEVARSYIALTNNIAVENVRVTASHTTGHNGITHVYLRQVVNGLDVVNAVANINIDRAGKIISVGNSFFTGSVPASIQSVKHTPTDAVLALAKLVRKPVGSLTETKDVQATVSQKTFVSATGFAIQAIPAELTYIQNEGTLQLTWELRADLDNNYYHAAVDTETNTVKFLVDWVADASYNVYPLGINDPEAGERAVVNNPANSNGSPNGWHDQGNGDTFTNTIGNNVYAQENLDGGSDYLNNERPEGGQALNFDNPINFNQEPIEYIEAAVTNLFYWNNVIHDLFYEYGFNEETGNFQQNNFGKGGQGNDYVIANAQDGSGSNNANFATPPDGQNGRMRMYTWTNNPDRDGDLEGGIVLHEYAHGISTRLTGGPADSSCLGFGEPGGMGEGWGDFFATITQTTSASTREQIFTMGAYSSGDSRGIRQYPYSTDMTVNPETYADINGMFGVHPIGAVWCTILYEAYWNVVDQNGFEEDWYNAAGAGGNVQFLRAVVDGLKIQPCDPTFIDARDAILQADEQNNNGANNCAIWTAFAKRGVGANAVSGSGDVEEDFEVPSACAAWTAKKH